MKLTAASTILAPVAWGTTYVTITELLPAGRPLLVAALRVLPAGLALVAAAAVVGRWRWWPGRADWGRLVVLALANFGAFFPLLAVAVYRLPGGVAASVGGLQPLLVAGLSATVVGTRPRRIDLAVGVVAAVGVGLVVLRPGADLDAVGLLAALAANLSFAIGVVLTKRFPAPPSKVAATGWQLLLAGALLVPLALAVEGRPPAVTVESAAGFAYLSLGGTAVAFLLWFNGIRRLPVAAPPLLGLAGPVTGATLGWLVLGQSLSAVQLAGFAVTLGAIAYGAVLGSVERDRPVASSMVAWRPIPTSSGPRSNGSGSGTTTSTWATASSRTRTTLAATTRRVASSTCGRSCPTTSPARASSTSAAPLATSPSR